MLGLVSSTVFLTGCQPPSTPNISTPATANTPAISDKQAETIIDTELLETETLMADSTNLTILEVPVDPMMATTNTSLTEIQGALNNFKFNQNPEFLNCAQSNLLSCQNQTASQQGLQDKNAGACDSITHEQTREDCKNQLWSQLANLDSNAELCNNITNQYFKTSCADQILVSQAMTKGTLELCDGISDFYQQDICRRQVATTLAVEAQDINLCNQIVMYEYQTVFPEITQNAEDGTSAEPANIEPEITRVAVPEEQNYERQNCISQVEMGVEMAKAEAVMAAEMAAMAEANEALIAEENPVTE